MTCFDGGHFFLTTVIFLTAVSFFWPRSFFFFFDRGHFSFTGVIFSDRDHFSVTAMTCFDRGHFFLTVVIFFWPRSIFFWPRPFFWPWSFFLTAVIISDRDLFFWSRSPRIGRGHPEFSAVTQNFPQSPKIERNLLFWAGRAAGRECMDIVILSIMWLKLVYNQVWIFSLKKPLFWPAGGDVTQWQNFWAEHINFIRVKLGKIWVSVNRVTSVSIWCSLWVDSAPL